MYPGLSRGRIARVRDTLKRMDNCVRFSDEEAPPRIEVDLNELENRIGRDALIAFSQCFVHTDRLSSVISCINASKRCYGEDSIAYRRDVNTMVWLSIGTLREMSRAIFDLRKALRCCNLGIISSDPWRKLNEFEKRWRNDRLRNQAAFHVTPEVVKKGLESMRTERWVTLIRGGPRSVESSLDLGFLAVINGLELTSEAYGEVLDQVFNDHAIVPDAVEEVFMLTVDAAGARS